MGQSFHWMMEKDRVLHDLSAMIDEADGSVAFVTPWRVATPDALAAVQKTVHEILERYLADVPQGPHPNRRHDPFEEILARSSFARIETLDRVYKVSLRPTVESLIGAEYSISHVLTRLGDRRRGVRAGGSRGVRQPGDRRNLGDAARRGIDWAALTDQRSMVASAEPHSVGRRVR